MSPADIIRLLELAPHPEGGHFRETWRAHAPPSSRAAGTAIYYLLHDGEVSRWHRIDADETWHWYAGSPIALTISPDGQTTEAQRLGPDFISGERPQILVPAGAWQSARSLGAWTLAGCTVSPGFRIPALRTRPARLAAGPVGRNSASLLRRRSCRMDQVSSRPSERQRARAGI